jgi:magnesium-protoporphyrin IX monomethyl ester (oxidative) cyclase
MNKPVSQADLASNEADDRGKRKAAVNDTTRSALVSTMLTPRFYTTDFDEMDKIDVEPVRVRMGRLISQMRSIPIKGHFKRKRNGMTSISTPCRMIYGKN